MISSSMKLKCCVCVLLRLRGTSSPRPRGENKEDAHAEGRGAPPCCEEATPPAPGLCLQGLEEDGRGGQGRGGAGVGIVHDSCEPRSRLATGPRCIDEQSDSVLGFENIIHLKRN